MKPLYKKITLLALLLYATLGFLLVPFLLKERLQELTSERLYATLKIDSLSFNPFLFKLRANDVALYDLNATEIVSMKSLFVDFELYSLLREAVHFDEISLRDPKIRLTQEANATFNLSNLLRESNATETNSSFEMPRLIFDRVSIKNATLAFEDYSSKTPFAFTFEKVGFELEDFDTQESDAKMRLFASLQDGGFIDLKTQLSSLEPLVFEGSLNFEASKLYSKYKYIQDRVNVEVADGKISLFSDFYYDANDTNTTRLENFSLEMEALRLKPKKSAKDILTIANFVLYDAKIYPFLHRAEIANVGLSGVAFLLKRDSSGKLDWSRYLEFKSTKKTSKKQSTQSQSMPWDATIEEFSLEELSGVFEDSGVSPKVKSELKDLNLYLESLTLQGEKPSPYMLNLKLGKKGECVSQGVLTHKELSLQSFLECKGINLAHFDPYITQSAKNSLQNYGAKIKNGELSFSSALNLQKRAKDLELRLIDGNIAVSNFVLQKSVGGSELLRFASFALANIDLESAKKSLIIQKAILNKLSVFVQKESDGTLDWSEIIKPKESLDEEKIEGGYLILLKQFNLKGASATLTDDSIEQRAKHQLKNINLNLYSATSQKMSPMRYDLSSELASGGKLTSSGKFSHSPLQQSGKFALTNLSLLPLTPYLQEYLHVSVEDGVFSLSGTSEYAQSSFAPDLRVQGSARLHSFFVNDSLAQTQLLSLADVDAKSYTLELNPNRLYIDELDVDAFYVDALIDAQRRFNFNKLIKPRSQTQPSDGLVADENKRSFPYKIAKANFKSGSAKFADYSIPIKFFTHIHDLDGSIYSISSEAGDTSYVDLAGEIDKYASVKINGSIDAGDPRVYTDMSLMFKNVDLSTLSGYSASFAGHEIDGGKLYLDLGYDIQNSHLVGKNSILIEQIKLGKVVQDENATVLPLGFVVGLLEDANGVIDVNMPIEGNMDKPDFRYGKIVLDSMGSLIASAVSSPFRFLGTMLGLGGAELEYVAFDAGSAQIDPPQREKLDRIAAVLLSKPNIKLIVTGQFEPKKDKKALQMQKLIDLVVEKSGIKNIQDHRSVMTIEMLEEIYEEYHDDEKLEETQERLQALHKDKEAFRRAYNKELIDICRDVQPFDEAQLIELAKHRADAVVGHLVNIRSVPLERLILKEYKTTQKSSEIFVKMLLELELK